MGVFRSLNVRGTNLPMLGTSGNIAPMEDLSRGALIVPIRARQRVSFLIIAYSDKLLLATFIHDFLWIIAIWWVHGWTLVDLLCSRLEPSTASRAEILLPRVQARRYSTLVGGHVDVARRHPFRGDRCVVIWLIRVVTEGLVATVEFRIGVFGRVTRSLLLTREKLLDGVWAAWADVRIRLRLHWVKLRAAGWIVPVLRVVTRFLAFMSDGCLAWLSLIRSCSVLRKRPTALAYVLRLRVCRWLTPDSIAVILGLRIEELRQVHCPWEHNIVLVQLNTTSSTSFIRLLSFDFQT